ncbi:MAG: hypothetical protein K2J74_04815 [Muribaculaceae bacterium]|nr:hypothetical protein [Muribaculaceae bacterium]
MDGYGIYNVVGGVVILFSFLENSLVYSIERFLNFYVGKEDKEKEQQIISTSMVIMLLLSILMIVVLETVGNWFINVKLNIPQESMFDANIVFQVSIITFIITTFRIPQNSLVVANEKMSFYAYISIIEYSLKLACVFLLMIIPANKLISYAVLIMLVQVILSIITYIYCKKYFPDINYNFKANRSLIIEITKFSGWNTLGGVAEIGYQQGYNMILNIFFGVAYNATIGIATQVKNAIYNSVRNVISVAIPQIVKSYAIADYDYFHKLLTAISKYAFFMFFFLGLPLILNMDYVLDIWLNGVVPPYATSFCNLLIIASLLDCIVRPLWTAVQSRGNLKVYQIVSSIILLANVPAAYFYLKFGGKPSYVLSIQIILAAILLIYHVWYLNRHNLLPANEFIRKTVIPIFNVGIISCAIFFFIPDSLVGLKRFLVTGCLCVIVNSILIFYVGLDRNERQTVISVIKKYLSKRKNNKKE